jgi:predicted nucleic acid-binding Zn ribbon protein
MYSWTCDGCGQKQQVIRRVADIENPPGAEQDDDATSPCTKENGHKWKRIPVATTFKLVGSGWFKDGY